MQIRTDSMIITEEYTILLVEDSRTIRFAYFTILQNHGFKVLEAENGETAWTLALENKPDIILLDLILPDISGFDVLKRIRPNEVTKTIPVVVLTNLKEIEDIQKAINLGANYYGYKGADSPQKIISMIHTILEKRSKKQGP
jgi:DNA-binding response OmpR family regulator